MATYLSIRKRVNYLIGESNYGTKAQNVVINDHILSSVQDIVRAHPFSWDLKNVSVSLSASGATSLASDYIPTWHVLDARIVTGSQNDDNIFTEVSLRDRDQYTTTDYVYWVNYSTALSSYQFNSLTVSGTLSYHYYFAPTDMSADTDVCVIPDAEAVAYLAASKIYAQDPALKAQSDRYEIEASKRIEAMFMNDLKYGVNMKNSLDSIKVKAQDGYLFANTKKG